jgi:transposase
MEVSDGKKEVFRRVQAGGSSAKDLGINAHMLGKWRTAIEQHGQEAFPGQGHARDEEMMQLKRELARVKKERDFLKEAAAFFAREQK